MFRIHLCIAAGLLFSPWAAGCSHSASQGQSAPVPSAAATSDPNKLAQQTSRYAQDVSPLLEPGNAAGQPGQQPSVVQWMKAGAPQSSSQPQAAVAARPTTQPAAAAEPVANGPASLASAKSGDDMSVPLILPESADHISMPAAPGPVLSTDETEKKLHQLVHDYPRDLGNQLDYQLLRFVREEQTPDLSSVTVLSSEDREILSALMDGLSNFRNTARADNNLMLSRKIQPLLEMADRLRSQAELTIPTVALCTRVDSFGVYRPLKSPRFGAGKENEVIVYCEVANFTSVQTEGKMWETRLKQEMVLYTDSGMAVWPEKSNAELYVDTSRNRRHDFFIPRKITLPQSLTIGRYLLKITLTDERSNRVAEATTPVEIVAQ